jgi:hypothetical protein
LKNPNEIFIYGGERMKTTMKKILSIVLVAMMCITAVPFNAFAAEETAHIHCNKEDCGSDDVAFVSKVEATCDASGGDVYFCNTCKKNFITNFEKPLGHDYSVEITPAVPGDGVCGGVDGATAVMKCSRCDSTIGGAPVELGAHNMPTKWTVVTPAVCGVSGAVEERACLNAGCSYKEERTNSVTDHTLVHNTERDELVNCKDADGKVGYVWFECANCDYERKIVAKDYAHAWSDYVETTAPTCDTEGEETSTCVWCKETQTRPVAALGHSWDAGVAASAPTCTEKGTTLYTCGTCGTTKTLADVAALNHDTIRAAREEATCTETGTVEYWYCKRCEKNFAEEACKTELTDDELVIVYTYPDGSKGVYKHTWKESVSAATQCGGFTTTFWGCDCGAYLVGEPTKVLHLNPLAKTAEVKATCTTAGNSEYYYCADCNKYFSDAKGEKEIAKDSWIVEAIAHKNAVFHAETANDCGNDGNTAYWSCGDCGLYFADNNGALGAEIAANSWVVPATGTHNYADVKINTPATCVANGEMATKCTVCGDTSTRVIPADGTTHNFDTVWENGRVSREENCALGIKEQREFACLNGCGAYSDPVTKATFAHDFDTVNDKFEATGDFKIPTCEEDGYYHHICQICKSASIKVDVDALGHDFDLDDDGTDDYTVTEPTCAAEGAKVYTCENCGGTKSDKIPQLDTHQITLDMSKPNMGANLVIPATCQKAAEYYWYCPVCKTNVLVNIFPNNKVDHNWEAEGELTDACTGEITYDCTFGCGETKVVYDATKIAHDLKHTEAVADTCTTVGNIEFWQCNKCKKYFSDAEAKTEITKAQTVDNRYAAHNYVENTADWCNRDAECLLYGYVLFQCGNGDCTSEYLVTETPLGHNIVDDAAVKPTCTETGLEAGSHCTRCDDATVKQKVIPATGHENGITSDCTDAKNVAIEDRYCDQCNKTIAIVHAHQSTFPVKANCMDFAYNLTQCDDCFKVLAKEITGTELGDHVWGTKVTTVTAPTCTEKGTGYKTCERCGAHSDPVAIDATVHSYERSEALDTNPDDDVCYIVTEKCSKCGDTTTTSEKHSYKSTASTHVEPTYTTMGYDIFDCSRTGCTATKKVDIAAKAGINFTFEYFNGNNNGEFIGNKDIYVVNGGYVTVKVYMEAWNEYASNINLSFNYDADVLTFVGAADTGIFDHTMVTGKNGVLTIFSYNDDGSAENIKTQGKDANVEYVTLTFKVATLDNIFNNSTNAYYNTSFTNFASEAYKMDETGAVASTLTAAHATETIHIHKLGAINAAHDDNSGVVDGADHLAILNIIKTKGYLAEADIDMDGDVDTNDYLFLARYNANYYSYAELVEKAGK